MKKKLLAIILAAGFTLMGGPLPAETPASEESSPFFRDSKFTSTLYFFQRYRDRYNVDTGHYGVNLSHATTQLALDFESGYLGEVIGLDLGVFGSLDFYNDGSPDHEMNFFPWRDPWHPDWGTRKTKDAGSLYKALVKVKAGHLWARAGYLQPQGPGVLGVNWSFLPGTYQGAEAGLELGRLTLATAWANQYKAPWFTQTYKFKKRDLDGELHEVDYVWSLGARYQVFDGLSLEAAYGESQNYLWNAHFKAKYNMALDGDKLYLTWQTYLMNDLGGRGAVDDNFSALAWHQYLAAIYDTGPWTLNLEFTYTKAPDKYQGNVGYFAYRLVRPSGGAKGAYEPWWDLRSDWNHNEEKAVFLKAGRALDDLGLDGFRAAVSGAYGWGGKSHGYDHKFREAAVGFDLSYTVGEGFLEGSVLALHFTRYDNKTDLPSWDKFGNAFQDEHDLKLSLTIPLSK